MTGTRRPGRTTSDVGREAVGGGGGAPAVARWWPVFVVKFEAEGIENLHLEFPVGC